MLIWLHTKEPPSSKEETEDKHKPLQRVAKIDKTFM